MSSYAINEILFSLVIVVGITFIVSTIVMLLIQVIESRNNPFDLLWRSVAIIFGIPVAILILTLPLVTPFVLGMLGSDKESKQFASLIYILLIIFLSILCQIFFVRHQVIHKMRDLGDVSFLEYLRFRLGAGRIAEAEIDSKARGRLRTDILIERLDKIRPISFGPRDSEPVPPTMEGVIPDKSDGDAYVRHLGLRIRWRPTLITSGLEIGIIFLLLWLALFSLAILPTGVILIPLLGTMLFLFFLGMLTDIQMNEAAFLISVVPMLSITLFISSTYLVGLQSFIDSVWFIAVGISLYFSSIVFPVLLFFAVLIGRSTGDWLLTGTTLQRFATRTQTLLWVVVCTIGFSLMFLIEGKVLYSAVYCVFFLGWAMVLASIPLDEKLVVGLVTSFLSLFVAFIAGLHINQISILLLIVGSMTAAYLGDFFDFHKSNIQWQQTRNIAGLFLIISLFLVLLNISLNKYYFSEETYAFSLFTIAGTAISLAMKFNLEMEESFIISSLLILIPPLFFTFFASFLIGQNLRRNVLCIAADGHRFPNRGERVLDDWLTDNRLLHEVHLVLVGSVQLSFLVKKGDRNYYLKYWVDIGGPEDMVQYHRFEQAVKLKKIKVDLIHPRDLDYLDSRLNYILKGTDSSEGIRR